jgi:hypothetical protein
MSTLLAAAAFTTFALAEPQVSPRADPPEPSEHRWRLHAEVSPIQMTSSTRVGFGSRAWSLGLPDNLSIGFGRALGRYVLIGARVGGELRQLSGHGRIGDTAWRSSSVTGGGWLLPYFEVRPLPALRVQPFGLVEGGVRLHGMRRYEESAIVIEPHRSFQIMPMVGGRVGLHAFVLPRLSVDADLGLRRHWSFEWSASPATNPSDASSPQPTNVQIAATVGLSGWW